MDKYGKAQARELQYWANTPHAPVGPWYYYDRKFLPFLTDFETVVDVGSGPTPYFLNHNVRYRSAKAVDPLISEYITIERYKAYRTWKAFSTAHSMVGISDNYADAVFALNVIDHVKWIAPFMCDIHRICKGRLFFYTDINKESDLMHPHKIDPIWLAGWLKKRFEPLYFEIEPSWKFNNDVFYFVGEKK